MSEPIPDLLSALEASFTRHRCPLSKYEETDCGLALDMTCSMQGIASECRLTTKERYDATK